MMTPVLFFAHGSPMNAIEDNDFTRRLRSIGQSILRPRAILVVSAHWTTRGTWVTGMSHPKTIHDFYGFPQPLFQIQYPAPGDSLLAAEVARNVGAQVDLQEWGLDHGAWSILIHLFPKADVPVVQLSFDMTQPPEFHFQLGQKLKYLRQQGVLILGSGNIVHNLRKISWEEQAPAADWAIEFDQWCANKIQQKDWSALTQDVLKSPAGKLSVPTWEHYLPLLYVLGASEENEQVEFDYEGMQNASISMRCVRYGKLR